MNITIDGMVGMVQDYASQAYDYGSKNPQVAAGTLAGLAALTALSAYLVTSREHPDVKTMRKLAREIIDLKPKIGDAASYKFVKTHGSYVNEHATKDGSVATLASAMRTSANGERKANGKSKTRSPEEILRLGKDLLRKKSGQCDHMAAAVIAKVVDHIKRGGRWNSEIELVGNSGHAFAIMNRNGSLNHPKSWGRAAIVDTWLGALGVKEDYADELTAGDCGVVSRRKDVLKHAEFFEPDVVTHRFTVAQLRALAKQ